MQKPLLLFVTFVLLVATSCQQRGDEVQPRNYDALALETGHWEWEYTGYFKRKDTPETKGFTRQLVFGSDGQVLIQHDGRLNKKRPYTLSMGPLAACASTTKVPLITYETDSDLPNNDLKTYTITKTPTGQTLALEGEEACIDGGAYESYRWVKE